jgi:hypothetical protein
MKILRGFFFKHFSETTEPFEKGWDGGVIWQSTYKLTNYDFGNDNRQFFKNIQKNMSVK